jgi:hypothetical protein
MRPSIALQTHRDAIREIALGHRVKNVRVFGSALHGENNCVGRVSPQGVTRQHAPNVGLRYANPTYIYFSPPSNTVPSVENCKCAHP